MSTTKIKLSGNSIVIPIDPNTGDVAQASKLVIAETPMADTIQIEIRGGGLRSIVCIMKEHLICEEHGKMLDIAREIVNAYNGRLEVIEALEDLILWSSAISNELNLSHTNFNASIVAASKIVAKAKGQDNAY